MSEATSSEAAEPPVKGRGPYLIIAALWQETDTVAEVADALWAERFPGVPGYRGAVVSFSREVADAWSFRRELERLDLRELNERPTSTQAAPQPPESDVEA